MKDEGNNSIDVDSNQLNNSDDNECQQIMTGLP